MKKKILIVDDEPMMLMLTSRFLSADYDIIKANSGSEAIKLYEKEHPDMILSDLLMPEMSGFEMHKQLQEKFGEQIPVMFMTADESDEVEGKGFDVGAADFIRKPFQPPVLLKRIENIFKNLDRIND
ncbi:MAG: response regulator, partial [Ruminiclostridium sp.]|nr:response regulator [Ruminiclostridium sp.]